MYRFPAWPSARARRSAAIWSFRLPSTTKAWGQTLAISLSGTALVAALVAQFALRLYNPWVYWTAVAMVSLFGTAVADTVHNDFGVPLCWAM